VQKFKTEEGQAYYYNKQTKETQWVPTPGLHLLHPEIQVFVNIAQALH